MGIERLTARNKDGLAYLVDVKPENKKLIVHMKIRSNVFWTVLKGLHSMKTKPTQARRSHVSMKMNGLCST